MMVVLLFSKMLIKEMVHYLIKRVRNIVYRNWVKLLIIVSNKLMQIHKNQIVWNYKVG